MALVHTSADALAAGERVQLSVGDTLRVTVGFTYTVSRDTAVTLRACPYHRVAGVLNRVGGSCGSAEVSLEEAAAPQTKEAAVDMPVVPADRGGVADGTYGLIAEVVGTGIEQHIDDCLVIAGNPPGMTDIFKVLPAMMVMMMMGMVMGTVEG